MATSIMVQWKDVPENGETAGSLDIIPLQWFSKDGITTGLTHLVQALGRKGKPWRGLARFDLDVRGDTADLYYDKHNDFNEHHFMENGRMQIRFANGQRRRIKDILWKDTRDLNYERPAIEFWIAEPSPCDVKAPPGRIKTISYRILRDTAVSQEVKLLHDGKCQLCGLGIILSDGSYYSEAHHLMPLGHPHRGPDVPENIICLCPNHHIELDYGLLKLKRTDLASHPLHHVNPKYISYHNGIVCGLATASK